MGAEIYALGAGLALFGVLLMLYLSMAVYASPTAYRTFGGPFVVTGLIALASAGAWPQSKTGLFLLWLAIQLSIILIGNFQDRDRRFRFGVVWAIAFANPQCRVHILSNGNIFMVERASGATAGELENAQVGHSVKMNLFKLLVGTFKARRLRRHGVIAGVWSPLAHA